MAGAIYLSGSATTWREWAANCIDIGLVNNMPDAALQSTERQFSSLLRSAARPLANVRLTFYAIPEIHHSDAGADRVRRLYSHVDDLWDRTIDGLIVTGTEPRTPKLKDEPYWGAFAKLADWASENTTSTILSCLAAHAAVLHLDGIERQPLLNKRFGLFECKPAGAHELTSGTSGGRVPHSRWNEIPENELASRGYRVLTRSDEVGADAFVKNQGSGSLFVFLQGHPEYDADTLLLEYRRDVKRFLAGERDAYPQMPSGYFDDEITGALAELKRRAEADRREELIAHFPTEMALRNLTNSWRPSAIHFYRNWIDYLRRRKVRRLSPITNAALERTAQP
jgi:homoserine O-succinyltransferase